jgi:beta-glucosidase
MVAQAVRRGAAATQQPSRQLCGFAKLRLDPGATAEVSWRQDQDVLAAFDEASGEWVVHPGRYELLVGRSSRDLRARAGFGVARSPVRS